MRATGGGKAAREKKVDIQKKKEKYKDCAGKVAKMTAQRLAQK